MFKGMKNTHCKAKAAVIVQNLLDLPEQMGRFVGSSHTWAKALVSDAYDHRPNYFNGSKLGVRPKDIVFAATSLAHGIQSPAVDEPSKLGLKAAFMRIMSEIMGNSAAYGFTKADNVLLADCIELMDELFEDPPMKEMRQILDR